LRADPCTRNSSSPTCVCVRVCVCVRARVGEVVCGLFGGCWEVGTRARGRAARRPASHAAGGSFFFFCTQPMAVFRLYFDLEHSSTQWIGSLTSPPDRACKELSNYLCMRTHGQREVNGQRTCGERSHSTTSALLPPTTTDVAFEDTLGGCWGGCCGGCWEVVGEVVRCRRPRRPYRRRVRRHLRTEVFFVSEAA
jgi:hypothetical protein